jgi:KUP system potassium uptake protein
LALHPEKSRLAALILGAIGVVYGDIGTSPLYTMKEVFVPAHGIAVNEANILGVVSLIFWGLVLVISLKYVILVLRADNRGEGGIMALTSLAMAAVARTRWHFPVMFLGMVGAGLFFGDGVITPAISVLSAVEGLEVATPAMKPFVLPATLVVLVLLYWAQSRGTGGIGKFFGPIMLLWFFALAVMGLINIVENPHVLLALNPLYAIDFMLRNGWIAFVALGAVVLSMTGAEALYADMSHFGKRPVRFAWFSIVFPALALSYFGQGAMLMANPAAASNPFFNQLGEWSVYPLVTLATVAAVVASQATISGAFSVTHQAISLGFLPRMQVVYTSDREIGQIYIPLVNWVQLTAVVLAVLGFGSSSNLASAYGIAATATMTVTTILTFFVIRFKWHYMLGLALVATTFFLLIDIMLFSSTALKIIHGGWFPLAVSALMVVVMLTWKDGRQLVFDNLKKQAIPLQDFLQSLFVSPPTRVEGTGLFFRAEGDGVPHAMLHNLLHNKTLHDRIVFLTVFNEDIPHVPSTERVTVQDLGHQCYQVNVYYGFKDERDIPAALDLCVQHGLEFSMMETSFFIARQTVIRSTQGGMANWRESLFTTMSRNARDAADYYKVPPNRVIELGTQIEI